MAEKSLFSDAGETYKGETAPSHPSLKTVVITFDSVGCKGLPAIATTSVSWAAN